MRVLIADDSKAWLDLLEAVLKSDGHEALRAVDGAQAWAVLQGPDAPRMAILDWMMPKIDGIEVIRRVRTLNTDPPPYLIMLTARDEKIDTVEALNAGANDYVAKPFNVGELKARVDVGRRLIEMQEALIESRRELAHLATHDPLTGLLNRRAILDRLMEEIARATRRGGSVAIGMCDIDHFKVINDTHGHQIGDDVLRGLARLMSESQRAYDRVGRFGGEEFLVVAPMEAGENPVAVFERLRRRVEEGRIATRSGLMAVTLSVGVVIHDGKGTADSLLTAADAALYEAKRRGRNRVVLHGRPAVEGE